MKNIKYLLAVGGSSLLMAGTAFAAASLTNGSFEDGIPAGVFTTINAGDSTSIDGWTVTDGSIDYIGSYWQSADGRKNLDMSGNSAGTIEQTFATVVGHTYSVGFKMAGNPDSGPVVKTLDVSAAGITQSYSFDTTGHSKTNMGWAPEAFSFTATSALTSLRFISTAPGFYGAALDNVTLVDTLTTKDQCKNGGWMAYTNPSFKNQGDCVSYVQSSDKALGNKLK